jgi:hypothetical protein
LLAVVRRDRAADRADRLRRHVHAVGTHIGDEADGLAADVDALIEPLRDAHRVRGREAELAARLLLHGRGGERGRRIALARFRFDRGDAELCGFQIALEMLRLSARTDIETLDLPAVRADEASLEGIVARGREGATSDQYSRGTNFSISSSRSATSRSATDCTRPAERAPGSLRHSTGESVKPTR